MVVNSKLARLGAILAGGLMLGAVSTANASLIGDTVTVQIGTFGSPQNVLVGAGTEIMNGGQGTISVDITASTILVGLDERFMDDIFFTDLQWRDTMGNIVPGTVSAVSCPSIDWFSLTSCNPAVTNAGTGVSVFVDNFSAPGGFIIYLTTTHVPEPGTLAVFGLGLAGLGFARRKKAV